MSESPAAYELRALFTYDAYSGIFRRRSDGSIATRVRTDGRFTGYVRLYFQGEMRQAARMAWLYVHGSAPDGEVDHINRNPSDNRIANLRVGTRQQNASNRRVQKNCRSGIAGVYWRGSRWRAQIQVSGRKVFLGSFISRDEARIVRREAERRYFGEFAP